MKGNVSWVVHSPGSISRKETYLYNILDYSTEKCKINYEVYHMLEYTNQVCEDDPAYDKDKCIDDYIIYIQRIHEESQLHLAIHKEQKPYLH